MRGGRRVRSFLESRRDLAIRVHYVWLPMFPRFAERRALPEVAGEFESPQLRQYWDGSQAIGHEFKERVVPAFGGDVAWDVWVLFGEEATWETAGEHVVGWGHTVVATQNELFDRLESIVAR